MLAMKIINVRFYDSKSPMILVEAPGRDPRPCIDYRKLSNITKTKCFPLPNVEVHKETVSLVKYITTMDLYKGYLTDSSDYGMGTVLSQIDKDGNEHPIVYHSKKFSEIDEKYGVSEKEYAAIIFAIQKLRHL
ncbi:hypothetical protein AVEN_55253-1 [Araneus ventricosus]|uniref:Reverse transcriptase RNase H-like domain-containing protein n=1 Tax=Araneus ventricosus TaxID=182803 RepID=A0A4Y2W577_ARAVE|nr:hypothetical protein AVEN_55253-1 [Araneus ventricosus]